MSKRTTASLPPLYLLALFVFVTSALPGRAQDTADLPDPARFSREIDMFRQWDRKNSFPGDAVLFVGSSSIRMWETAAAFPGLPVINRGFGGAIIPDVRHYYEETIGKYDPQVILFYTGDNDIAIGMSPDEVFANYTGMVERILADFPGVTFVYLPIKPSSSRWNYWERMQEVNRRVRAYNETNKQLHYVDLATPLLGANGRPDDTLYLEDRLHLNKQGYAKWNRVLGPVLEKLY